MTSDSVRAILDNRKSQTRRVVTVPWHKGKRCQSYEPYWTVEEDKLYGMDEYGDWYLLKNTHSALARNRDNRPDPFAFTSDELIKEIHDVGAMHIYNTDVKPLDINDVIEFISNAL